MRPIVPQRMMSDGIGPAMAIASEIGLSNWKTRTACCTVSSMSWSPNGNHASRQLSPATATARPALRSSVAEVTPRQRGVRCGRLS